MNGILVLNSDYSPLNVTSFVRGFNLVYKGKAEIIKSSEEPLICGFNNFMRPLIIRLLNYVSFKRRRIRVNRNRIMKRDNYSCVYCGSKKNLTIDHLIPKSKGGGNSWDNLVTCCSPCNIKKGDKLLNDTNMKLQKKPSEPTIFSDSIGRYLQDVWIEYQNNFK